MSYSKYIELQLKKSSDPPRIQKWLNEEKLLKIKIFENYFISLFKSLEMNNKNAKILCLGARTGHEVITLQNLGFKNAIGIDLVQYPPLVFKGDFHQLPFKTNSIDFIFSNCFDHSLYPEKFLNEIYRILKINKKACLHFQVNIPTDEFGVTNVFSTKKLEFLFKNFKTFRYKKISVFSMNYEYILTK